MFCFAPISLPSHSRDVSNTSWLVQLHVVSYPEAKVGTLNEWLQLIEPAHANTSQPYAVDFINILCSNFHQYFGTKKSHSQTVIKENLLEALLYEKMLIKLTHDGMYWPVHLQSRLYKQRIRVITPTPQLHPTDHATKPCPDILSWKDAKLTFLFFIAILI